MSTVFSDISAALDTRLSTLFRSPPVAWENIAYKPIKNKLYLRPTHLPSATVQAGLGTAGIDGYSGLYQEGRKRGMKEGRKKRQKEARKERRKERGKDERTEGWKEGLKDEWKEKGIQGRNEERTVGSKDGWMEGRTYVEA